MTGTIANRLLMVTAVWGDWHLRMLFEVNLPTLLAEGNLPALARTCRITYLIFTQRSDRKRLEAAPQIRALREFMDVQIELLDQEDLDNPIAAHHKAWDIAVKRARHEGQLILLMPPDVAWSNNAFSTVGDRLVKGHKAIFMTYMRAVTDGFVPALFARANPSELEISVTPQDMVQLCLQNLHPLMAAYLRSSDHFPYHPEMILWTVPGEGVLARVLAREMFLFDPAHFVFNEVSLPAHRLDPAEICFIADSEDLFAVSLAPLGKDAAWHLHPRLPDPIEIGGWWLEYDSPVNDYVVDHRIRWHFAPVTEEKWRARERGSDLFLRRTAVAREGIRLWHAAHQLGCTKAASILALAIHTGALAHAARGRGPALIFLPSNKALSQVPATQLSQLLSPSGSAELSALIRATYVPDFDWSAEGDDPLGQQLADGVEVKLTTASRQMLKVSRDSTGININCAKVCGGPVVTGGHAVYVVDRLLSNIGTQNSEPRQVAAE